MSIHPDCRCSACSLYLKQRFFTSRHPIVIYTCIDVNDVLTFCDFTQSYCNELLMRASAWMTKGNNVWKRKRMFKHATTWHHMPHHQKCAYSAAHAIHGWWSGRGGSGGGKLAYLRICVGLKDNTYKKAIYPQNHWIIFVPRPKHQLSISHMCVKLTLGYLELNNSECAIDIAEFDNVDLQNESHLV